MKIASNIPALNTVLTLRGTDRLLTASMQRLSTGRRINSARDDAAGLAIANKLSMQVMGLSRASQNAQDGVSLIQTADGALNEIHGMLQRMRELAVQAANGALLPEDRAKIQMEVDSLEDEITASANKTEFNKMRILNGEADIVKFSRVNMGAGLGMAIGDGFAQINFVSDTVPSGNLDYTVVSAGLPASAALANIASLAGNDYAFYINEVQVAVAASDTLDDIRGKITAACDLAAMDVKFDASGNNAFIATQKAGVSQSVNITSVDPNFPAISAIGSDAVVRVNSFNNENGVPNANFLNGVSVLTNGNEVTISNSGGQTVRLTVKVLFNTDPASADNFLYGNGSGNAVPPFSDGIPVSAGGVNMAAEIRNYGPIFLQIGPDFNQRMPVQIPKVTAETLGFVEYKGGRTVRLLNYKSFDGANEAIGIIDRAIAEVSNVRSSLGAYQNRLDQTVRNLDTTAENVERSRSRIEDTDMAMTMAEYTRLNVKYQAAIAILAQANLRPQQVLSLLQ
ncbi:MAG: hypothetical protein FWF44_02845 [Defluviitaleaceae bacterium]|nr:hypothetical protein [Defluviitaleaceae bacterium]